MSTRNENASYWGGGGHILRITGADPAAGAEVVVNVPVARRWKLYAVAFQLVTDATVATRHPALTFDNGADEVWAGETTPNHPASTTINYRFGDIGGGLGLAAGGFQRNTFAMPVVMLGAGFGIRTLTLNLQAGDNYSAPILLVEEWVDVL